MQLDTCAPKAPSQEQRAVIKSVLESLLDAADELNQQATCTTDLAEAAAAQMDSGYDPYSSSPFAVRS